MTKRKADDGKAAAKDFQPFADDDTALTIGGCTVENGTVRVSLSGSLDVTMDKAGLERAQALKAALDAIVATLTAKDDLPEKAEAEEAKPAKTVRNPFA